ncbi:carbonyl reductase family member 4 [Gorgonomyces haynaldii]|nr:carbonyl reductase family member 4 [Gorgonomyces haynaldii]
MTKIALVTGASSGIGRAIAQHLSRDYQVYGLSRSLHNLPNVHQIQQDVRDDFKLKLDQLDVLVNCAGVNYDQLLARTKDDEILQMLQTNLLGTIQVSRQAARIMMKQRSGVIVNISSVVGNSVHRPGQSIYAATKAGVVGFTKSLAKELAGRNVRVNCLLPGFIDTKMTQDLDTSKLQIPLGRLGNSQDIIQSIDFLIQCQYITGQCLTVDGGLSL